MKNTAYRLSKILVLVTASLVNSACDKSSGGGVAAPAIVNPSDAGFERMTAIDNELRARRIFMNSETDSRATISAMTIDELQANRALVVEFIDLGQQAVSRTDLDPQRAHQVRYWMTSAETIRTQMDSRMRRLGQRPPQDPRRTYDPRSQQFQADLRECKSFFREIAFQYHINLEQFDLRRDSARLCLVNPQARERLSRKIQRNWDCLEIVAAADKARNRFKPQEHARRVRGMNAVASALRACSY